MTDIPLTSGVATEEIIKNKIKASRHLVIQKLAGSIPNAASEYIKIGSKKSKPVINKAARVQLINSSTAKY